MRYVVLMFLSVGCVVQGACAQASGRTVRYVKAEAAGNGDGTSWANAYGGEDWERAIEEAPSGTDVYMAVGKYTLRDADGRNGTLRISAGVHVYGGFPKTGTPALENRIKTPANDAERTILSGDIGVLVTQEEEASDAGYADNVRHVVTIEAGDVHVEGVTIEGGFADGLVNEAGGRGAGIYIPRAAGDERRTGTIKHVELRYLHAPSGAAIFVEEDFVLEGLRVQKNVSYLGLINRSSESYAVVYASGEVSIQNSRIYDNTSVNDRQNGYGGGMYLAGKALAVNCLVYGNKGSLGAGIYAVGPAMIVNCTVYGNESIRDATAEERGGGIYLTSDDLPGTLVNTVSVDNESGTSETLTTNEQDNIFHKVSVESARFLIQSVITGTEQRSNNQGNLFVDVEGEYEPKAVNMLYEVKPVNIFSSFDDKNNKDFLKTKSTSPAVNSGVNEYVTAARVRQNVLKDIAGNRRILGGQIDIGAFETSTELSIKAEEAFEPTKAPRGRVISIRGEGFSSFSRRYNKISFLGVANTDRDDASVSRIDGFVELADEEVGERSVKIKVKIPKGAVTGKIKVTINGGKVLTGDVLKIMHPDSSEDVPAPMAVSKEVFEVGEVVKPCDDGTPPPCKDSDDLRPYNIPHPERRAVTHESVTTSEIKVETATEERPGTKVAWCLIRGDQVHRPTSNQVFLVSRGSARSFGEGDELEVVHRGTIEKSGPLMLEGLGPRRFYVLYLAPFREVATERGGVTNLFSPEVAFLVFETTRRITTRNCDPPNPDPGCPNPTLSIKVPFSDMRVYPNPSVVGVSPRVRCEGSCWVRIYRMSGEVILAKQMTDGQALPLLEKGIYVVRLSRGEKNHTQRIILR